MSSSASSGAPVLTVDAGSGSGRALVFDADGTVLSVAQREWSYQPTPDAPGGIDFPTDASWAHVCTVIREAIAQAGVDAADIKGVTATSMREGIVLWDGEGKELWAVPNADARAGEQAVALIEEGLAEPIYRTGGDWTSISAPGRLRWVEQHRPQIWERAQAITLLGDWVLGRLSGELATDPTLGSSSGLFDLSTRQWSKETARTLGIEHLLVPVHEPGTVFGEVSEQAARETGLAAGTPIISGGADTQLALLGGGVVDGGWGVVGGTFWLTAAVLDEPVVDPEIRLRTLCHVEPGTWMVEGVGFLHGLSTRYVRDGLLRAANPSIAEADGYVVLDDLAKDVPPGSGGVRYTGSNVMNARAWKHGPPSFVGLNLIDIASTGLGSVFRAVLEEGAYVARGHLDLLQELRPRPDEPITFVGGPSFSSLWPQILSDVLGAPVQVPSVREATCLGAALCALVGTGAYSSLTEAAQATTRIERHFEPDADAHAAYDELYPQWRAVTEDLLAVADAGHAAHMWKGAGA